MNPDTMPISILINDSFNSSCEKGYILSTSINKKLSFKDQVICASTQMQ
jgi:hypothetical protein